MWHAFVAIRAFFLAFIQRYFTFFGQQLTGWVDLCQIFSVYIEHGAVARVAVHCSFRHNFFFYVRFLFTILVEMVLVCPIYECIDMLYQKPPPTIFIIIIIIIFIFHTTGSFTQKHVSFGSHLWMIVCSQYNFFFLTLSYISLFRTICECLKMMVFDWIVFGIILQTLSFLSHRHFLVISWFN